MTDKHLQHPSDPELDEQVDNRELDPREVEVRLAIADYVISRVAGTPAGQEIFNGLIRRFENRFPQHKLLAYLLTSPGHLEEKSDDHSD